MKIATPAFNWRDFKEGLCADIGICNSYKMSNQIERKNQGLNLKTCNSFFDDTHQEAQDIQENACLDCRLWPESYFISSVCRTILVTQTDLLSPPILVFGKNMFSPLSTPLQSMILCPFVQYPLILEPLLFGNYAK